MTKYSFHKDIRESALLRHRYSCLVYTQTKYTDEDPCSQGTPLLLAGIKIAEGLLSKRRLFEASKVTCCGPL
jgi:hypothetical protein